MRRTPSTSCGEYTRGSSFNSTVRTVYFFSTARLPSLRVSRNSVSARRRFRLQLGRAFRLASSDNSFVKFVFDAGQDRGNSALVSRVQIGRLVLGENGHEYRNSILRKVRKTDTKTLSFAPVGIVSGEAKLTQTSRALDYRETLGPRHYRNLQRVEIPIPELESRRLVIEGRQVNETQPNRRFKKLRWIPHDVRFLAMRARGSFFLARLAQALSARANRETRFQNRQFALETIITSSIVSSESLLLGSTFR